MKLIIILLSLVSFTSDRTGIFELEELSSPDFQTFISRKKVIVIGEVHGTAEVPQFLLQLIKAAQQPDEPLTVGLEIDDTYQKDIDGYMKDGDFARLLELEYFKVPDGRASMAIGGLIKGLRNLKDVRIVCFDVPSGSPWQTRDSLMGVNLSRSYDGERMVILTGNLHANLKEGYWRPGFKSAIWHFNRNSDLGDGLLSLETYFGGGTIWNCMNDGCRERDAWVMQIEKPEGIENYINIYDGVHPGGHHGFVYFERVTASRPLVP